jgi:hypothetical protein
MDRVRRAWAIRARLCSLVFLRALSMKLEIFSYRYAREILEHPTNTDAWQEIISVCRGAPVFEYSNKSQKNAKLSVVQHVMNAYFDRRLAVDHNWLYHPLATTIQNSGLAADFRKRFANITIQAEVQFGNMSRWYSDIFKFQTAYSQSLIQLGLSIVPVASLARRIDSNIVSYERVMRELPSAELSITLPLLIIGLDAGASTQVLDLRRSTFDIKQLTKKGTESNRYRIVEAFISTGSIAGVGPSSPTGPTPRALAAAPADPDDDEDND